MAATVLASPTVRAKCAAERTTEPSADARDELNRSAAEISDALRVT